MHRKQQMPKLQAIWDIQAQEDERFLDFISRRTVLDIILRSVTTHKVEIGEIEFKTVEKPIHDVVEIKLGKYRNCVKGKPKN